MSIRDTTDNDSDWEDSGEDDDSDDDDTSSVLTSMSSSSVVGVPDTSARQPLFSAASTSSSAADKKTCDPVKVQEELKAFFGKRDPRTFICQPGNKYRLILTEPSARATAIFKTIGSDLGGRIQCVFTARLPTVPSRSLESHETIVLKVRGGNHGLRTRNR